jgi:hypothetical protein
MWLKVNRLFKFNHGIKFKETHTLHSFFYDVNITAGRHFGPKLPSFTVAAVKNLIAWRRFALERLRKRGKGFI